MPLSQKTSTFLKQLKALLEVREVLNLFLNAGVWRFITFFQGVFCSLESFMRNRHTFLSKDNHSHHLFQPIVKSERSVSFISKYCSLKTNHFFRKVYLASELLLWETLMCFSSKGSLLFKHFKPLVDMKWVLHCIWNTEVWKIITLFGKCI